MTEPDAPAAPAGGAPVAGVSFVSAAGRAGSVPLAHPIDVDGVRIDALALRRLTGGEVAALADAMTAASFDDFDLFACITDQPPYVLRALDGDDWLALREAGLDFLPRRFRVAAGLTGTEPGA